jgi:hypothetical protein
MWWRFMIGCTVVVALWVGSGLALRAYAPSERGTFGDMFGAINSLFTGLAFWCVVMTMWQQQKAFTITARLTSLNLMLEHVNAQIAASKDSKHPLAAHHMTALLEEQKKYIESIKAIEKQFD